MLLIERPQTDPYFNLAAEEYLLKNLDQDCFMLWVNEPSVILGKHQNAFAEINRAFVEKNKIPVIRRISGGGTVFHDPGNLNFTFISRGEKEKLIDFRKFTRPVIDYLNELGLPAQFEGKNDIRIEGLKVSGNAEHVYRDKVLHHGTLLYSSRLGTLNEAIRGKEKQFHDKAVKSVRSQVTNISSLLPGPLPLEEFKQGIIRHVINRFANLAHVRLSDHDIQQISLLAEKKYRTWEWNYGYSPRFEFRKKVSLGGNEFVVVMDVREGIVAGVDIDPAGHASLPFGSMIGLKFDRDSLLAGYSRTPFAEKMDLPDYADLLTALLY